MGPGDAIAAVTLFLSLAAVFILRGPLGKALAETEERLDFAERMLARHKEEPRLPGARA